MKKLLIAFPLTFLVGLAFGFFLFKNNSGSIANNCSEPNAPQMSKSRQTGYKFVNPLLDCDIDLGQTPPLISQFEDNLKQLVSNIKDASPAVDNISVYYRDLNNGPGIGLKENAKFSPASLLKLPLMIAYFKLAETDPQILSKKMTYVFSSEKDYVPQTIVPIEELKDNQPYTVEELITHMIKFSDNHALILLYNNLTDDQKFKIYSDLGITVPNVRTPEDFMTVKEYAAFYRVLYNASYLNVEMSEKALDLLTHSEFDKGILAGVPPNTMVAHKFGEREAGQSNLTQLHDCGIVYYPNRPYLICVMTRGQDIGVQSDAIKQISKLIYDEVDKQSAKSSQSRNSSLIPKKS